MTFMRVVFYLYNIYFLFSTGNNKDIVLIF
jgi:hypothetical protein